MSVALYDRQYLSAHFQRWEFTASETAARRGINNVPSAEEWANLKALCTECLEPARLILGRLHITSGYRCPALNTAVGGAPSSQHIKGQAADVIPYERSLPDLFKWLYVHVPFDQLIWEFGQWVHVSHVAGGPNRKQALIASRGNERTIYAPVTEEHMAKL